MTEQAAGQAKRTEEIEKPEVAEAQRITLDLAPQTAQELARLRELTGLTKAELFRHAFNLLRLYVKSAQEGREFCIIDPSGRERIVQLPIVVQADAT